MIVLTPIEDCRYSSTKAEILYNLGRLITDSFSENIYFIFNLKNINILNH